MSISSTRRMLKQINFNASNTKQFSYAGAALVILNMAKDAIDTFKPYKTPQHRARDLEQLNSGLKNTLKALVFIPISALWLIAGLGYFIVAPILGTIKYRGSTSESTTLWSEITNAYSNSAQMINASIETLVGSLTQTLRGVTQMVAAPLTLLRIPLRDYLSQGMPEQKFQDRKSIQSLLAKADKLMHTAQDSPDATANMRPILDELYRKSYIQRSKKQALYEDTFIHTTRKVPNRSAAGYNSGRRMNHTRETESNLDANYFFKNKQTTGSILPGEIALIQNRLNEFRIP